MTLIEPKFELIRASLMVFLYQFGIGTICCLFLYLLGNVSLLLISLLGIFLGGAIYASQYEKKKPGILELYTKKVAFNISLINFLLTELIALFFIYVSEELVTKNSTSNNTDHSFLVGVSIVLGVSTLFAVAEGLVIYFGTLLGLEMGIKHSKKKRQKS